MDPLGQCNAQQSLRVGLSRTKLGVPSQQMPKKTLNETGGIAVGLRYSALLNAKPQHRRGEWGEGVRIERGN
jgi:hypothetical protein